MQNRLITRWELSPVEKFEKFLIELVDYLRDTLVPFEEPDGQIQYICTKNLSSGNLLYMEPFERVENFCKEKNLNPQEIRDMIDEYTEEKYICECYLLHDKRIRILIERKK
jgi:hypothetical protein